MLLLSAGGPGHEASRPIEASGWLKAATATHRVFLLDQRGTGRSSRITVGNLPLRGTPQQQADYLQHFRYPICVSLLRSRWPPAGLVGQQGFTLSGCASVRTNLTMTCYSLSWGCIKDVITALVLTITSFRVKWGCIVDDMTAQKDLGS